MAQYIDKSAVVAEIEKQIKDIQLGKKQFDDIEVQTSYDWFCNGLKRALEIITTIEVKEMDSITHTIIAECCDWLTMNTNLSHDKIEGCRNLMLTVKEEQFKAQKGEEV